MKELLDLIIKLLQRVAAIATVLEIFFRVIRHFFTH